jgi:hypothetical protein
VDQALFELPEHALGPSWAFLCACVARPQELLEGARVLVRLALELPENAMGLPGPFFVCVCGWLKLFIADPTVVRHGRISPRLVSVS